MLRTAEVRSTYFSLAGEGIMTKAYTKLEFHGVGVEWTERLEEDVLSHIDQLSCFELIPENFFFNRRRDFLKRLGKTNIPVLIHGVELSVGTDQPFKQKHFDAIREIADYVNTVNFSDHLSITEAGGVEIGQLTPIPWSIEACDAVCRNIDAIQSQIQVPFLIENVANRFVFPETELRETEFINLVVKRTGCYLLLDLHNIHVNSHNFGYDPFEWVSEIDMDLVEGIHIAGGFYDEDGTLVDGHSSLAPDRVWDLYRYVCERTLPSCTIVEWTENPPPFEILMGDVERANSILAETSRTPAYSTAVQEGAFR